jgi:outer membrane protein TolC
VRSIKPISFLILFCISTAMNAQKVFSNLDSLLSYSSNKSTSIRSGYLRLDQSKKAKLAAIYGVLDLNGSGSFNITNNTKLPVSLFPAEIFGGQPGTYKEVQTGIKYNSTGNLYGEVKLINIAGWQNVKLSKINLASTEIDNRLSRKNLYENIAAIYFNIVSLNEQLESTLNNISIADTLLMIVSNKYKQGITKQQEVNSAKVNLLNSKESASQINYLIQQQYIALQILCDIPESDKIKINQIVSEDGIKANDIAEPNPLKLNSVIFKEKIAFNYYKQLKYAYLPTITAFASNAYQQFSQQFKTFDGSSKWINSNYIGVKAVFNLPSANAITQSSKAKYDYLLAKENSTHANIESPLECSKLNIEYAKAISQFKTNKEIATLQIDSYNKNLGLYKQGLTSLDQLMNSFNTKVSSEYNLNASSVNVLLSQSKIDINNKLK